MYTAYQQDDWLKWLGLTEFAVNNAISEAIQCSFFYVNYEYNLYMGFKPHQAMTQFSLPAEVKAEKYTNHIEDLLNMLCSEILVMCYDVRLT